MIGAASSPLVLRDVHVPPAPSWWPPAPGWWLVLLAVLVVFAIPVAWLLWKRRRRRRLVMLFEQACTSALAPPAQVAAASELLRRAARRVDSAADRLQGDAWLRFLDGKQGREFSEGVGQLLKDGGFRPRVDPGQLERLRELARGRFVQLMEGRR
ncbi:DUF4381 domain-containing protein [Pseudoxanthomonas sp.]|uniref:DUF4381 domain-containing protein n=1 Tax=Pseudoxanthomonas sp. TaxID=1871049 RepID=UPI00260C01C0|nr:DUF4381 domain-containing protein [Pseudoxanthomonas sp.]WDS37549.1 MAG: DUF4381 domain-containing protein [Pseudoxanthomonas sp.]